MAAEHAQLLASLAVGQVRPGQPGDGVGVRTEVIPVEELHADDTGQDNETDSVRVAEELQGNVPTVIYGNLRKKRKVLIEDSPRHSDFKVVPVKERSSSSKMETMRRPVRPIDRQKMRPWLKNLLDKGSVFGLNWTKREEGVFQISWRHASRLGWNLETDGDVFERWARHTGIYKDGDIPEPKRWKANFRCALHSLPDVKELTSPDDRKGRNASRTYRFLTANEIQPPVKRKHRYSIQLPYLYEHANSEDSGSQNSDERNSDEEVTDGQPRQVPHCDHDYAARVDKIDGGLTTSAIFQRHGSGYVLIKSKDAHEYEFRLTSSGEASAEPKPQQKSPPKKSPVKKRKPPASKSSPTASSPSKRSKGKDSVKGVAKPKGGKKLAKKRKKVVSTSEKGTLPGGKPTVTLQALLAGRQVNKSNTSKRPRPSRSPAAATRKTRIGKAGEAVGKGAGGKGSGAESGQGTPTQRQGLDACMLLLEAATQLDRMDSLSSSETPTTSTKPAAASRAPPKSAPPQTKAATSAKVTTMSSAPVTTIVATEAGGGIGISPPASVATVFVPAVSSSAPGTLGAMFSMPPAPPGVLQQYIGLATESTASKTPALSSLLSVATHVSTPGMVLPTTQLLAHPFKVVGFINSIEPALGTVPQSMKEVTAAPTVVAPVPVIPTAVTMAASVHSQAATPPILTQPASSLGAGTSMLKHLLRLTCPPPKPMPVTITTASAPSTSQKTASVNVLPFTAPVVSASASEGGEGSTSVLVKEEQVSPPVEENSDSQDQGDQAKDSYEIVAEVDLGASQENTWEEKGANNLPYLRVSSSKVIVKQEQGADDVDAETVSSQAQLHTEAGDNVQDTVSQPAASVDSIMQFLNLCSANSNSQVMVKTETPVTGVPDDVIAINSAYSSPVKPEPQGTATSHLTDSQEFMNRLNQLTVFVSPNWAGEEVGETSVAVTGLEGIDPEQNYSQGNDSEQADTELHVQQGDSDDEMPVLTKEEPQEL